MTGRHCRLVLPIVFAAAVVAADPATDATTAHNRAVLDALPFADTTDFERAERGLIGRADSVVVRDAAGAVVWDMDVFDFVEGDAPDTVNPSLWRQAQLNSRHGLYAVTDGIYQVRGYDVANLSIIEGDSGYIVVDPLLTRETAAAAMAFAFTHLPRKPVVAVIYSHSHADHFGGVKGVVSLEDVTSGRTRIVASEGFMENAISENILAGNVMTRRASYMFGALLPKNATAGVGVGLGQAISQGEITLIPPTHVVTGSTEELTIDGLRFVFMNTPYAEAPAELMFYLPEKKAFYAAEEANGTMHNLYTLRGAQTRDALLWSGYLHAAAALIDPDTDVLFGGHHWPRWGYDDIVDYLQKQGDLYKYIHDQTLRLANHGLTMDEIAAQLELPPELSQEWYNRGYYGTLSHNSRAVYNKYLGYFDGNPANMQPLPPATAAQNYVDYMGGAEAILEKARAAFADGQYRWVVEVVNHVVFAEPENDAARDLQAQALQQLGYQAESGQWRNFYLSGASELRNGIAGGAALQTSSPDMINNLALEDLFDYLAVRLDGPAAAGRRIAIDLDFEDADDYRLTLVNGVLHHARSVADGNADARLRLTRSGLLALAVAGVPAGELAASGEIDIDGDVAAIETLFGLLDDFEFWFEIVTP